MSPLHHYQLQGIIDNWAMPKPLLPIAALERDPDQQRRMWVQGTPCLASRQNQRFTSAVAEAVRCPRASVVWP